MAIKFDLKELTIGRVLGRGGFCVVSDITKITLLQQEENIDDLSNKNGVKTRDDSASGCNDEQMISNIVQDRNFMAMYCVRKQRGSGGGGSKDSANRYAIKRIQESSFNSHQTFINAVVDLAIEARFLSVIRHPNIIKMRAMERGSPYSTNFFVVLDRLYDIMPQRLAKWKKSQVTGIAKLMDRKGKREMALWVERVTVAYDLACALKYLHDLKYVHV